MKKISILLVSLIILTSGLELKAQTAKANAAVNEVIFNYLKVKNALLADNNSSAQANAKSLYQAVGVVPAAELTSEQRKLWETYTGKLQNDSKHISESAPLDQQRGYFVTLSQNLFQVLKMLKVNADPIYQQFCPMKNATWLSESSDIKNPYYGTQMSSCGKVIQTLNPATK